MASAGLREQLQCSVCLSVYTDPVTLTCGHSFCRVCIDAVLDTQVWAGYSCPECREEFQERPELRRNIRLRNIAENILTFQPDQVDIGIPCTYCTDSPVAAVRSCLFCEVSLCKKHLRAHKQSPEHVLTDPTANPEVRKCSVHKKILEYYCTEDAACICVSCCLIGEHKGHNLQSLEEACEEKKWKLRNILQKMTTQREKTEERVQSLRERRARVQENRVQETERVRTLFRDLRRQLDDLEKRVLRKVSQQAQRVSSSLSDLIQQLEIKMEELCRRMGHIEEMCKMTDPLTVLQEPDTGDLCDTEEGEGGRHDLDVTGISHTLHTGLSDIITWVQRGHYGAKAADISLDVNTAHNHLIISDDLKSASLGSDQKRPHTPERFMDYAQVLSSQSFSSGRHYWEVDVQGEWWWVGMCYPSIDRREDQSEIGYNKKSWSLGRWYDQYWVIHDGQEILLPTEISSNRVRIFLDYEAGQISFYDLSDPIRLIHTFTSTFTEPLHAGLGIENTPVSSSRITISSATQ